MKKNNIIITIFLMAIFLIGFFNYKVYGASANISAPSQVYVGDTITVRVSGNAASWSLDLSASGNISGSGGKMANATDSGENENVTMGTFSFKATSVGSATFSLSGTIANADYSTNSPGGPKTVKIVEKPVEPPKTETKPTETKKTETKTTTTTKTTEKKQEEKSQEDDFYITSLTLKGIKENEEKVDIVLSPEFKKDVYEYTAVVSGDIVKLDIQKDAGKYNNSIIIEGGEQLKVGENIITLQLSAEDHKAKVYRIKVTKEELKEEIEEPIQEIKEEYIEKEEKEPKIITMPLWAFLLIQAGVIILEVIGILIAFKIKNSRSGDIASERLRKWR